MNEWISMNEWDGLINDMDVCIEWIMWMECECDVNGYEWINGLNKWMDWCMDDECEWIWWYLIWWYILWMMIWYI